MKFPKICSRICKPAFFLSQILLLLAFACSPAPTEIAVITPTSSPPATMQLLSTETPVPTSTTAAIPTSTSTPFVPKAVIKIVIHGPLSGNRASSGQELMHGAELAIQQLSTPINALGYKVESVSYDDQSLMETALANARQIVADPQILCGVGHYDSDITMAASEIYHYAGLAFIVPSVTDPDLTARSFLEVNRLIGRGDGQGLAAARFAKDQGFTRVYIVTPKGGLPMRNADSFRVESGKLGIQRVGTLMSTLPPEYMDTFVTQIMDTQPDLIYVSNTAHQAIPFLVKLRAAGYTGAFLGTERLDNQSAIAIGGSSLVAGGGMFYTVTSPPLQYYSDAAKFVQDFHNQFDTVPHLLATKAYDATGICLKAIEEASKANNGELPTRAEVARAIRDLKDYQGITGTYNFNDRGNPDPMQYYVYHVVSTDATGWDQNPIVSAYEITLP